MVAIPESSSAYIATQVMDQGRAGVGGRVIRLLTHDPSPYSYLIFNLSDLLYTLVLDMGGNVYFTSYYHLLPTKDLSKIPLLNKITMACSKSYAHNRLNHSTLLSTIIILVVR